jgi:outer membrane protein assembly factor BamA
MINFQFFLDAPIGTWIPYSTDADFFILQVERRIWDKLYGGITYVHTNVLTEAENLPVADTLILNGLGLSLSLDRSNNPHYPRSGHVSNMKFNSFPEFFGNEEDSHKLELEHMHYFSVRSNKDVLAARAYVGLGLGDVAFSQQIVVGRTDIRGYTQGAFRGDQVVAVQGEYRWNFLKRWGAVGFMGAASVFNAINESDNGKILPGAGAGIRFKAFTETNFSVGLDVAVGRDDWGIYFQIGEAF